MPIKPNNTDKLKNKPSEEKKNPLTQPNDVERESGDIQYGRSRDLNFNPDKEVTQDEEYRANGLPRTSRYSVHKPSGERTTDV
ncbi:MAG: hypothetical protein DI626_10815 [Micavibrio aeruginosavorus]|uniref:Uncharacterized protein n=1 Tax=Micavibrio aeruginosavorus TaxID=349221 RepID=A0A2W5BEI8_9BACT|nr:MAG: hypothetical protein DI626_10815 [Micavibrio aeruginosavorus]